MIGPRTYRVLIRQYGAATLLKSAVRSIPRRLWPARAHLQTDTPLPFNEPDRSNGSDVVESHGARFAVRPHSTDHGIVDETWQAYVARLQAAGRTSFRDVVDLGAQIGSFSVHLALNADVSGRMIAIEPEPGNFALLRRNVELNGLAKRIEIHHAAASDRDGIVRLALSDTDNTGGHFITSDPRRPAADVRAIDIRSLVDSLAPGILLKLDIEGSEYVILRRLGDRLRKIDAIVGEFHMARFGRPAEAIALLRRAGFSVETYGDDPRLPGIVALRAQRKTKGRPEAALP